MGLARRYCEFFPNCSTVLPQLNFMGFNMLAQGAQRYGKHPWHWYASRAAPFILGSLGLPLLPALVRNSD